MVLFHPSSYSQFISKNWKSLGPQIRPEELTRTCLWPFSQQLTPLIHNLSLMRFTVTLCLLLPLLLREDLRKLKQGWKAWRETKRRRGQRKEANRAVTSLLEDLREKNLINEELKERLEFYSVCFRS